VDRARLRSVLDVTATVLVLVAASAVIALAVRNWRQAPTQVARQPPAPAIPTAPQPVEGAQSIGSRSAGVAMIIYSDFECPYCGTFARESWPSIKRDFVDTGRALVVFKHLPLPMHAEARGAAIAAECAAGQGKFWPLHDLLFQNQSHLSAATERALAATAGIDLTQFDACVQQQPGGGTVARDVESARTLGINSTPTFLVGHVQSDGTVKVSEIILGAQPADRFRAAFERAGANRRTGV
jgi:protein-disulfide isomerase